ncbi:hypothetical protein L207DRAFT_592883 [Hyaloscypha variabilis F]|uniref:SprT-like domain-containing protein n=1 Tax=Hyaloscypha variabilis (strain UAMH 11265 / GT02V1 / F) TaxID=1149755 RepID=A0A2J6QV27_HYAVF|nr:hypothetical protein L207DRAFT_592883 [Hyaloscypha variabilis F]
MPHHGHHHGRSNDKNDHDRKKSDNDGHRQKTNRPSYLSYLDDHEPGKTTHPQFLDELPKNKLHRYHPKELSYLLQQNSNRRKISQLSATAQHRLKRPVRVCSRGSDVQKLVEEWLPVLDEIFFFSTVGPHLKNGVHLFNDPDSTQAGFYIEKKSYIKINTDHSLHSLGDRHPERGLLATLLHEMVHAFLTTFSCHRSCCKKCRSEVMGHEAIWCNAMAKIEAKLQDATGWDVDCNMSGSVMADMEKSNWQPKEDQLRRWGLWGKKEYSGKLKREVGFLRSEWPRAHKSCRRSAESDEHDGSDSSDDSDDSEDSRGSDDSRESRGSIDSRNSSDSDSSENSDSSDDSDDSDDSEDFDESTDEESDGSEDDTRHHHHSNDRHSSHRHRHSHDHHSSHEHRHSHRAHDGRSGHENKRRSKHRGHPRSAHPQFLDNLPDPKLRRFHPEDIGKALRQNARDQSFSQLSERTQSLLRRQIPHCESRRDVRHLMEEWMPALDEIFYFGQVRRYLKGGIRIFNDEYLEYEGRYDPYNYWIDINLPSHQYDEGQTEKHYIDTLVHEMLHAFQLTFTCRKVCCWAKIVTDRNWGCVGLGHGPEWFKTMKEIEEKMGDLVDWDVDCGIADSKRTEREHREKSCKPM